MASRKVIRDLVMTKQPLFLQLAHQRVREIIDFVFSTILFVITNWGLLDLVVFCREWAQG